MNVVEAKLVKFDGMPQTMHEVLGGCKPDPMHIEKLECVDQVKIVHETQTDFERFDVRLDQCYLLEPGSQGFLAIFHGDDRDLSMLRFCLRLLFSL